MSSGLLSVLLVSVAVSVITDLRARRIRNVVTLPALVICLVLRGIAGGWGDATGAGLFSGAIGFVLAVLPFLALALVGGVGMGDVKLMGTVGAAVGFPAILPCLFGIAVAGGLQAVAALLARAWFWNVRQENARVAAARSRLASLLPLKARAATIPYAVAIALGTGWGVWMTLG